MAKLLANTAAYAVIRYMKLVFCSGNCGDCNKPYGGHGNGGCDGDCNDSASLSESTMVFSGGHCGGCNKPCGGHGNGGCGGDKDDNTDN